VDGFLDQDLNTVISQTLDNFQIHKDLLVSILTEVETLFLGHYGVLLIDRTQLLIS